MSDNEVQVLQTEFQGLEKSLKDLFKQTEKHVDGKFEQILNQLKETDELLRGNAGNPGMNGRLNHVEKMQKIFLAVFVAHYFGLIDQLRNVASAG